jgi:hypothetical protein
MNDTSQQRHPLLHLRDEQLNKLVALATDRRAAEALLTTIRALDESIYSGRVTTTAKYAKHKSAIHAILDYLDEAGRPVPKEQIIKALCEGGWRGGIDGADVMLRKSIGSFIKAGRGTISRQIKEVNGMIGRGEWSDDLFKAL